MNEQQEIKWQSRFAEMKADAIEQYNKETLPAKKACEKAIAQGQDEVAAQREYEKATAAALKRLDQAINKAWGMRS